MAQDITNSTRSTPRFYRARHGSHIRAYQPSTCVSSAVIAPGDVVQYDANVASNSFRIVKASTMANVPNVISTLFIGIAAAADASDGSTLNLGSRAKIAVYEGRDDCEFIWPTKATVAQHQSTLIGTNRPIGYDSTLSMFYVDIANSTAGDVRVRITDVLDPGSSNGTVIGKFLSTAVAVVNH